ncbi:MAG: hypothetical protein LQ343_008025 [Gyalolechia ehrenbergii]|nr:MAG: hypothetical protein LQ343_008025 [Gyalolechia ehrenbergii]
MSKKSVVLNEKSLPPTPRPSQEHDLIPPKDPQVCMYEGLHPRSVSATFPEVPVGQGLERAFEGLEFVSIEQDPAISTVEDGKMPSKRRKKRYLLGVIAAVLIATALAAGLGKGLQHGKSHSQNAIMDDPPWKSFNASKPLPASYAKPAYWRSRSIYQIMTDRFAPSDNSFPYCHTEKRKYCGGTWKGITNHLDYVQNMGFTAASQLTEITSEGQAYHGYWQQNLYALNSQFGSIEDLQELSTALHARNMYLIIDVVVNHYGWAGDSSTVNYSDIVSLPDVNTTDPFVMQTYSSWIRSLALVFAVDGLRIDTVKHVEKSFWPGFRSAAGVYSIGEVLDGDINHTCSYQEELDGVLNYPLYYRLIEAFRDTNGNMTSLSLTMTAIQESCQDSTLLGTFSENHDNPRFLSHTTDMHLNMNVIAFTLLAGGIPIIYQGQEQGFSGADNPSNREALWTSSYSTQSTLYRFIASINQIRNRDVYANPSSLTSPASVIYSDDHNIALRKGLIVSLFSNRGTNASAYNLTLTGHGYQEKQVVVEILSCQNHTVAIGGNLQVSVQEGSPQVSRCE